MIKRVLFIALIFGCTYTSKAQNEPELIGSFEGFTAQSRIEYIDHGLPKIIARNLDGIEIYNLDLSLYSSFVYPDIEFSTGPIYITRSLFDCDSTQIEYLISGGTIDSSYVRIYREDGSLYFDIPGYNLLIGTNLADTETIIGSDENGSYALFSVNFGIGDVVVYRFCGQVPQPLARESDGSIISGIMEHENHNGFDLYPNPAREVIKFEYDLQGYKKAKLQLFTTSGQLMKELMLGQAFDHIRLNISDLEQGTYIARITTDDGFELSEKFVKVD